MPKIFLAIFILLISVTLVIAIPKAFGDELDDINKQIDKLTEALNTSEAATVPLEEQVANIKGRVAFIEQDIINKKADIEKSYVDLEDQQDELNAAIRDFYIKSYYNSPILIFLSSNSASRITQLLAYQKALADQDKQIIINIALLINSLEDRKKNLESEQVRLASTKANLDKIIKDAKLYQGEVLGQLADLRKQQQAILSQRLSSLNLPTSLGAGPLVCVDDREDKYNPGFSPAFAFFTAGIPHRVGLNQYGALGRSQAGQSSDEILRAYFNFDNYQNADANINVNDSNGYNSGNIIWSGNLDEYVKRIYEVPESWPKEALKAQAIAARSFAISKTNNGADSICATQSCQVFKTDPKTGAWAQAVDETAGQVMVHGGQTITAWFASTAGGYTYTSSKVWGGNRPWTKNLKDTPSNITSFSDLENNSYDKDSPCNYAAQGTRAEYNKSAWMKQEEVADIANVILLSKACPECGDYLYQVDKPHPQGREIWDYARVRQELSGRNIAPFTNVSTVSIGANFDTGYTTSVTVSGNRSESFSGSDFKKAFNLRAPANIQIVGPLFNAEKK